MLNKIMREMTYFHQTQPGKRQLLAPYTGWASFEESYLGAE